MCKLIDDFEASMKEIWDQMNEWDDQRSHIDAYYWHMQTVGCSDNYRYVVEV